MHVLDNPIWHALTGPHATLAELAPQAARYQLDVSVFAALPDDATSEAWDDLRDLIGPGGTAFLAASHLEVPSGWSMQLSIPCRQMWLPGALVPDPEAARGNADVPFLRLGERDVPAMLALVERTHPGPFAKRTIELGTYLGVRDGDELVALAGERLHPPGFTEISAVCTDASHRGRGLASRLVRAIVERIWARGEKPFLHLTLENEPAHRIYAALGFETRAFTDVVGLRAPN
jgi:GNAT superfamily N-acetyltransferase